MPYLKMFLTSHADSKLPTLATRISINRLILIATIET